MSKHTRRFRRAERDEAGLVTLEWLLIVGAVAGLAALAVVLVYSTVEETGDRFAAPIPRLTAAQIQAAELVNDAKSAAVDDFDTWGDWERYFSSKCARIEIIINDDRITVTGNDFNGPTGQTTAFNPAIALTADTAAPTASKAQANCTAG